MVRELTLARTAASSGMTMLTCARHEKHQAGTDFLSLLITRTRCVSMLISVLFSLLTLPPNELRDLGRFAGAAVLFARVLVRQCLFDYNAGQGISEPKVTTHSLPAI